MTWTQQINWIKRAQKDRRRSKPDSCATALALLRVMRYTAELGASCPVQKAQPPPNFQPQQSAYTPSFQLHPPQEQKKQAKPAQLTCSENPHAQDAVLANSVLHLSSHPQQVSRGARAVLRKRAKRSLGTSLPYSSSMATHCSDDEGWVLLCSWCHAPTLFLLGSTQAHSPAAHSAPEQSSHLQSWVLPPLSWASFLLLFQLN